VTMVTNQPPNAAKIAPLPAMRAPNPRDDLGPAKNVVMARVPGVKRSSIGELEEG
jgi:hypothetical protein